MYCLIPPVTSVVFALAAIIIGLKWPHSLSDGESKKTWLLLVTGFFFLMVGEIFNAFVINAQTTYAQLPETAYLLYLLPRLVGAVALLLGILSMPRVFTLVIKKEEEE